MRNSAMPQGTFKPKPTIVETKQDATTRAALEIIGSEAAARDRKTERLRLARLAKEATEVASAPEPKRTAKRKKA